MILQALNRYYDILRDDQGTDIATFGYSAVNVSFALDICEEGELLSVLPLFDQVQRGKKMVDVPRSMIVPKQVKRSSGVKSNFLCDNSAYVLGLSDKDETKPKYSLNRFVAFQMLHIDLLTDVNNIEARSLLAFLQKHDPSTVRQHPAVQQTLELLLKGGNLIFQVNGKFVSDNIAIRDAWEKYNAGQETVKMQCLVTGEISSIARLHPNIKRVRGAKSSGATLVGFNAPSYESYNRTKKQGLNSPISKKATFAYTTTLNYLLSDANPNQKFFLGDTTVVYWAEGENRAYESAFSSFVDPSELEENSGKEAARKKAEGALESVVGKAKQAQMMDLDALLDDLKDENPRFYILGLSPNAARVSVRFFITDPFQKVAQNIMAHYRDLEIVKEYEDQPTYLSVWRILNETVSKKSKDKDAAPLLAGAVFRAILTNAQYPAALYYAIINRIRADMDEKEKGIKKINYVRAAIIKAFLIRKYRYQENPFKEVLTMALNEQSTIPAYLLGRIFAVLEKVQGEAIGKVNASIKDRYFTSACASPASVFPILLRLSQHHIAKAEYGYVSERKIQDIMNLLDVEDNPIPQRLTLDEQGVFVLGYYHQRANFYVKKNKELEEINQSEN
jgi:CRISPR-associated protein Csd1